MDDITLYYRRVFSSNEGKFVLAHMLYSLGMFDSSTNRSNELRSYGANLLEIIGCGRVDLRSIAELITSLMNQEIKGDDE